MKTISLKTLKCKMKNHNYEYLYSFLSTEGNVIFRWETLKCKNCKKYEIRKRILGINN